MNKDIRSFEYALLDILQDYKLWFDGQYGVEGVGVWRPLQTIDTLMEYLKELDSKRIKL